MFVGNEGEPGIWDTDDQTSDKQSTVATKGSGLNVNGSNDEEKFDGSTGAITDSNQVPPDGH